jgi:uncharacterized RDD family membrane protein YckC
MGHVSLLRRFARTIIRPARVSPVALPTRGCNFRAAAAYWGHVTKTHSDTERHTRSDYTYTEKPKRTADYPLADLGTRLVALIIDNIILGLVAGIGFVGTRSGGGAAIGFLLGLGYQWYFLTQHDGQTLGKQLMGIRVVKINGEPLQTNDAVLRYIGYYLNSAIAMLGWLWAAVDSNRQGLHDKLAGTIVVRTR